MSQASLKTKFVYSFISGKDDYYLEQLIFSILSLRRYNPTAYVEVLTDDETKRSLTEWRSILYELIDCLNIVDIPRHLDKMKRSRYIKTKLRLLTKGDYLFLDTDTVICGKLSSIEDYTEHIMMVADCNDSLYLKDSQIINRCEIIGFKDMAGRPYYNSGVMRVKDSVAIAFTEHGIQIGLILCRKALVWINRHLILQTMSLVMTCRNYLEDGTVRCFFPG